MNKFFINIIKEKEKVFKYLARLSITFINIGLSMVFGQRFVYCDVVYCIVYS